VTKITVQMDGARELNELLGRAASLGLVKEFEQALYGTANEVLNQSKKIVPVDLGALKDSGKVEKPKRSTTGVSVEITYGGTAAPYALYVHEDPSAQHKSGKTYHFLKIPVDAARVTFVSDLKKRFITYLRRK
jgi:hypothetical protein